MNELGRWGAAALAAGLLCATGCLRHQVEPIDYQSLGERAVRVDEADIRYRVEGPEDGPRVVMIHGFGSRLEVFEPLMPELAGFRVLRLDLKGFGLSSRYEGDYRPEAQVEVVLSVMDEVGFEDAALVAHSMGSLIALGAALAAPERVHSLALLAPWVYRDQIPWGFRAAAQPAMGELIFGLWFAEHLDDRFRWSFYEPDRWVSQGMIDRARPVLAMPGSRAASLAVVRGLPQSDLDHRFHGVHQPVLLLPGEEDQVALLPYAEALSRQLPAARLEPVPLCGHFPMVEARDRVARRLRAWLRNAPRGRR